MCRRPLSEIVSYFRDGATAPLPYICDIRKKHIFRAELQLYMKKKQQINVHGFYTIQRQKAKGLSFGHHTMVIFSRNLA